MSLKPSVFFRTETSRNRHNRALPAPKINYESATLLLRVPAPSLVLLLLASQNALVLQLQPTGDRSSAAATPAKGSFSSRKKSLCPPFSSICAPAASVVRRTSLAGVLDFPSLKRTINLFLEREPALSPGGRKRRKAAASSIPIKASFSPIGAGSTDLLPQRESRSPSKSEPGQRKSALTAPPASPIPTITSAKRPEPAAAPKRRGRPPKKPKVLPPAVELEASATEPPPSVSNGTYGAQSSSDVKKALKIVDADNSAASNRQSPEMLGSTTLDMTFTGSMSSPLARHTAACEDTPTAQTRHLKRTWYSDRGKRIQNIGYESRLNAAVAPSDYIKWLPQDAAAPDKMRQLLIWCFQGQLGRESTEEDPQKKEIAGVAKLIETEILSGLVNGKVSVDWTRTTNDEDLDDTLLTNKRIVKANTVNRRNARDIELFTEKLARLRDEEASWSRAYKVAVRPLETLTTDGNSVTDSAFLAYLQKRADGVDLRHDVVERGIEKASNSALARAHKSIQEDLDANTDKIFHLLHRLKQGVVLATKLEQEKFSNKMSHLVRRFASYKASSRGGREYTARELLRGISRVDVATGKAVK